MPLRIVRNDITKMQTEAIVNTANEDLIYSSGCDTAIYMAAGKEQLLSYRREHIGYKREGDVFITPGFDLAAKYIIHAVSPYYVDGEHGEEALLRKCYRKSLKMAVENDIKSIAFPLISTGGFGYPKEEGIRIAVDEINSFLLEHSMDIYLVVFDARSTMLGEKIYPKLEAYIDQNYVSRKNKEEYGDRYLGSAIEGDAARFAAAQPAPSQKPRRTPFIERFNVLNASKAKTSCDEVCEFAELEFDESALNERMQHMSDTFSQYLMYLIESKGMENVEVYKRAIVDKKMFSKLKNNQDYHPQKITALCLCVGAMLNIDETKDLLARAGYALSPCDKTDIIFSFFIENEIYDMIEIDIQLEEHGLPCIIQ